jgi:hypothetical protein
VDSSVAESDDVRFVNDIEDMWGADRVTRRKRMKVTTDSQPI